MEELENLLVDLQTVQDRAEVVMKELSTQLFREENVRSPVVHVLRGILDSVSAIRISVDQDFEAIKACKTAWEALDRYW